MKINEDPVHKFRYSQISNYNFTFAMLDGDRYLHTPFMCKDYLQDIFWSEAIGRPIAAHGLEWTSGRLPPAEEYRLALHGGQEDMARKAPFLQEFLNRVEQAQGFPLSKVETTDDPHLIVVTFNKAWTTNGPLVSALTSIIRISGAYEGGDPIAYLDSVNKELKDPKTGKYVWDPAPKYMQVELMRRSVVIPRLKGLLAGKPVTLAWKPEDGAYAVHNFGIVGYAEFPTA